MNSPRATIDGRAADRDTLDLLGRAVDLRVEPRGPADLARPARSRSPRRRRSGRAARGARRTHPRPTRSQGPRGRRAQGKTNAPSTADPSAAKQIDAVRVGPGDRREVGGERGHLVGRVELDEGEPAARGRSSRPAGPIARRRARRAARRRPRRAARSGSAPASEPKMIRAPSRSSSTGTTPAPVSRLITIFCSGPPRTNADPSVGCPANGSSVAGVKIRIRTSAPSACGGSTNAVSESCSSRASACIVSSSRSRASVNTASWLPARAVSAKTSTTT